MHRFPGVGIVVLVVGLLAGCGIFPSKEERQMREYQRYIQESMRGREERRAIIAAEKQAHARQMADQARRVPAEQPARTSVTVE